MKKAKKLVAVLLAIATLFTIFATSASALEKGDYVEWFSNNGSDVYYYEFAGTLNEGSNVIGAEPDSQAAYEFTAEKSGYYEFYALDCYTNVAEKYEKNVAYDHIGAYGCWTNDDRYVCLYYLNEGTTLVEVVTYGSEPTIGIAYAGNITDVIADEGALDGLIIGENVFEHENGRISVEPFNHYLKMDTGKDYAPDSSYWSFGLKDELKTGENTIVYEFGTFTKELTADIHEITEFISRIELENIEPYLYAKLYYNGSLESESPCDYSEKMIITFTDGTKEEIIYSCNEEDFNMSVVLPNGTECWIYAYQYEDEGDVKFTVEVAGHLYIQEDCIIEKADFSENLNRFRLNIEGILSNYRYHLRWCLEGLMGNGYNEPFYYIPEMFESVYLKAIFSNITDFIGFFLF